MNLIQPLPLPGSLGAPYFDGKNDTAFIQLIEDLFEDCQIPFHERRAKIVRYCTRDIRTKVERIEEYREERFSLERLYKALRFQYRERDDYQQKYTVKRLDEVVREGSLLPDDRLEEYLDAFHDISTGLASRGVLSRYDRGVKFMKGLPKPFRNKVGRGTISIPWAQNRLITSCTSTRRSRAIGIAGTSGSWKMNPSVRWAKG
jgi:hypothetical protein